ncbi:DUF58 domain-containing protein [soil metagenome]
MQVIFFTTFPDAPLGEAGFTVRKGLGGRMVAAYLASMSDAGTAEIFDASFLARLERLRLQVRKRMAGTLRAERRSRRTGSSLEFADYRNYARGDDPRRIDWSIYGRVERLMVKLYEEEEDLDVAILVDQSESMRWNPPGGGGVSKFIMARQAAAALSYVALRSLDRVGVFFFDSALRAESGFLRGRPAFREVLAFLRSGSYGEKGTDLAQSLGTFARGQKRRGLAIVISDCLDPGGFERGLSAITGRHFALHLLHVMDSRECEPAEVGDFDLTEVEGGTEMQVTAGEGLLKAYRKEVEMFRDGIKTWCGKHQAGYSFLLSTGSFEDAVLRIMTRDRLLR